MKSLIVIPTYNEEKDIDKVVIQLKEYNKDILIVDDGSTDATLSKLKTIKDISLLTNGKNKGKGFAIRRGLQYALKNNYDLVILMDGDGQHNPAEINNFIEKSRDYDLVIGNRMHNSFRMPFIRYFVNWLDSSIVSKIISFDVKDVHCGYRALKTNLINKLDLKSERFEIEAEIVINTVKNKAKVANLNIECIYLGQNSSINPITDMYRFIKLVIKSI